MKLTRFLPAVIASALLVSPAIAADTAPLPAGKPAGTKDAALFAASPFLFIIGIAAVVGIAVAVSNNGGNNNTTTTGTGS